MRCRPDHKIFTAFLSTKNARARPLLVRLCVIADPGDMNSTNPPVLTFVYRRVLPDLDRVYSALDDYVATTGMPDDSYDFRI